MNAKSIIDGLLESPEYVLGNVPTTLSPEVSVKSLDFRIDDVNENTHLVTIKANLISRRGKIYSKVAQVTINQDTIGKLRNESWWIDDDIGLNELASLAPVITKSIAVSKLDKVIQKLFVRAVAAADSNSDPTVFVDDVILPVLHAMADEVDQSDWPLVSLDNTKIDVTTQETVELPPYDFRPILANFRFVEIPDLRNGLFTSSLVGRFVEKVTREGDKLIILKGSTNYGVLVNKEEETELKRLIKEVMRANAIKPSEKGNNTHECQDNHKRTS